MTEDFVSTLLRGFSLFQAENALLPPLVLAWMWVMRIVFGASIIFLPRPGALTTLVAMLLTALSRFYIKGSYPDMPASHIGALTHVVLWIPLVAFLVYSMRRWKTFGGSRLEQAYAIWLPAAIGVLTVSLVFDVRAVLTMSG